MKIVHVEGAILAGGASRRMGRDKATLEYRGVPMAERVARSLGECFERVRVVLRPGHKNPLSLAAIEDAHEVRAPIVGLHAALGACDSSAVCIAACDLPEIDPRLVLALVAAMPAEGGPEIVAPESPRGPEPLLAIYRPSVLPRIEKQIRTNLLSLQKLLEHSDTCLIPERVLREIDPELRSLRNVNRLHDVS